MIMTLIDKKSSLCGGLAAGKYLLDIMTNDQRRWARYSLDGERVGLGAGRCAPSSEELEEMDILAKQSLARLAGKELHVYVRFGGLPPRGRSKNHATGRLERGVSCVEAWRSPETGKLRLVPYGAPSFLWVQNRPAYIVSGEYVGEGSDGEPLLRKCKIVRALDPEEIE